jgi:class 3 adenylate cyclase
MAALEMVAVVRTFAPLTGWDIRVGLHSGPVVAGVVGTRKFAFDIWGNTVNLASRMESSGVPGRVNLSEETYRLMRGMVECEDRGFVHTKDGREVPMFLVRGPAADFAARYEAEFGHKQPGLVGAAPEVAVS